MAVRVQELQDLQPSLVRQIAGRWEGGLRALLGLAGAAGLIGAPLTAGKLSTSTQALVGVLLGAVLLLTVGALLLTMAAAYGSARRTARPASQTHYERLRQELADRGLRHLLWGRRLAVAALLLIAATTVVAWTNPWAGTQHLLRITSSSGTDYCGVVVPGADRRVTLLTTSQGRVDLALNTLRRIETVDSCRDH